MLVGRYRPILYLQYLLLLVDIFMNTFTEMLRFENVILLVLYVIQDICIVFSVIIIFLLFFNTFIFQAGLVSILVSKFKAPICITFVYFSLCLGLHVWTMSDWLCKERCLSHPSVVEVYNCNERRWGDTDKFMWNNKAFHALYIIQRTCAVLHYYFYKRTALKLGDPRYYQDSEWIHREFERRR